MYLLGLSDRGRTLLLVNILNAALWTRTAHLVATVSKPFLTMAQPFHRKVKLNPVKK